MNYAIGAMATNKDDIDNEELIVDGEIERVERDKEVGKEMSEATAWELFIKFKLLSKSQRKAFIALIDEFLKMKRSKD